MINCDLDFILINKILEVIFQNNNFSDNEKSDITSFLMVDQINISQKYEKNI